MYTYLHSMGDTTKDPCHVPFCSHRDGAEGFDCTFIRFPLDRWKRNQWIQEISAYGHLEKEPTYLSKICSCHFENGDTSLQLPNIFPWTEHPEHYQHPKTDRARKQLVARQTARLKASKVNFEKEKSKVDKDTVYCDSIILTFDTSQITGNKRSSSMSVGSVRKGELLVDTSLTNGAPTRRTEHKSTQTAASPSAECALLRMEVEKLKNMLEKMSKKVFGVRAIRGKEEYFKFYTGVGEATFNSLVTEIVKNDSDYIPKHLSIENEVLLTLMKLRLNTGYTDLALRFNIPQTAICPILTQHIEALHSILFVPMRNFIAIDESGSRVELTKLKTQKSIINCTNIVAESAIIDEDSVAQKNPRNSFKVLMGVTSDQVIKYCSDVFRTSTSKEEIFRRSDLSKYLKPGDLIINDRDQALLKIVLKDASKIPEYSVGDSDVYRQREHLCFGRTMRRIRNYQIIPFFPQTLFKLATKIVQVCVALTNYQNPNFWDESINGTTISLYDVEEQVEVVFPEDEDEEVTIHRHMQMDSEQLIEVETEMDGEF